MTRVDFYIIDNAGGDARQQVACRLAEKAYQLGHRVYIHADDQTQSQALDDLLWTFKQGSFVPHCLWQDAAKDDSPVVIGWQHEPQAATDVLINLSAEVPLFFSRFARVAEVVSNDEGDRARGRERFKFYRERGYSLETHTLNS